MKNNIEDALFKQNKNNEYIYYIDCEKNDISDSLIEVLFILINKNKDINWNSCKDFTRKNLFYSLGDGNIYCTNDNMIKHIISTHQNAVNLHDYSVQRSYINFEGDTLYYKKTAYTFKYYKKDNNNEFLVYLEDQNQLPVILKMNDFLEKFSKY